jgi:hypothetical protein
MAFELPSRQRATNSPVKVVGAMIVGGIVVCMVLYGLWLRMTRRERVAELMEEHRSGYREPEEPETHEDTLRWRSFELHGAIVAGDRKAAARALDLPLLIAAEGTWAVQPEACKPWLGKTTWITTFQELDRLVDCLGASEGSKVRFVAGCRTAWGCQHRLDTVSLRPR